MKIGIVTLYASEDNYGQLLQCFALQKYLRDRGHDPFLIRNESELKKVKKYKLVRGKLRTAFHLRMYPTSIIRAIGRNLLDIAKGKSICYTSSCQFNRFKKINLKSTSKVYLEKELNENPPFADIYFVGSDQVWNSGKGLYYLSWLKNGQRKISYAASFGSTSFSDEFYERITPWLNQFETITVREKSGLKICERIGISNAVCVPDPTFLLKVQDYDNLRLATSLEKREKYILLYLLGTKTNINISKVYRFAKKRNLKVIYIASQGRIDKYKKNSATIEEWISYIANAEYVFTNSFHGTVFSLLYNKKFLVFLIYGHRIGMNDRIYTLLDKFNLKNRIFSSNFNQVDSDINYKLINNIIEDDKKTMDSMFTEWLDEEC